MSPCHTLLLGSVTADLKSLLAESFLPSSILRLPLPSCLEALNILSSWSVLGWDWGEIQRHGANSQSEHYQSLLRSSQTGFLWLWTCRGNWEYLKDLWYSLQTTGTVVPSRYPASQRTIRETEEVSNIIAQLLPFIFWWIYWVKQPRIICVEMDQEWREAVWQGSTTVVLFWHLDHKHFYLRD